MSDKMFVDSNLWLYAFVCKPGEESKHTIARELVEKTCALHFERAGNR